MKKQITAVALSALAFGQAAPLAAQSINPALDRQRGETQITAAITVPLGASRDARRTAPRLEIVARSSAPDGALPVIARDNARLWQERRIGFTLDGSNAFMLNGQPVQEPEQRDGVSTLGAIAIGVGALLAIGTIALADAINDLDD